jgi:hypothetical protein
MSWRLYQRIFIREKPQYLTKDGFKRLAKNPYATPELQRRLASIKRKKESAVALRKSSKGPAISDEAARLIAQVLKGMLASPRR